MAGTGLAAFADIIREQVPLGPLTCFGVGGVAERLAEPRTADELAALLMTCQAGEIPVRLLGGGRNLLVASAAVSGVVVRLSAPAFGQIEVSSPHLRVGAGAPLADAIAAACSAGLAGLEALVGIPGHIGGALRRNVGSRGGDIGQFVQAVELIDPAGHVVQRTKSQIRFGNRYSNLDDGVIIAATFKLFPDEADAIARRLKKIWIARKAQQPFEFQNAGYVFGDARGLNAADLIQKANQLHATVGGAELSDRDPRYIVAKPGTQPKDIVTLIDLVRTRVQEQTGVELAVSLDIW